LIQLLTVNIDVGREVGYGMCVSFVDLLKLFDIGDPLLVLGDDVIVFDPGESVAVFQVAVVVLTKSFITSHPHSSEVVSVAKMIISRLVVGCEELPRK
jgi:hypothetical protein